MYEIEISDVPNIIDNCGKEINLMFVGDTGIGKTSIIEKYCKDNNIFLKTLILSQIDASESLGIPIKSSIKINGVEHNCLESIPPKWVFELKEHENSILFLDEFLCSQPSVMNAFLNFLTQKRVGDIDLHHVRIIAATNIGMYTFEPDNNIISRFCFFYTVNTKMNDFIKDKRILNDYQDENPREGVLFEERSLKPRCQELLSTVSDDYLPAFYEGFTNRKYMMIHENSQINNLIGNYFKMVKINTYTITDVNINTACALMKTKFSRIKNWDKIMSGFVNLDMIYLEKIRSCLYNE